MRLGPPHAVIGKTVGQVAQGDLRPEFRGKPGQAIRPAPRTDAARDPDDDEGVEGETIALIHALDSRFVLIRSRLEAARLRPARAAGTGGRLPPAFAFGSP